MKVITFINLTIYQQVILLQILTNIEFDTSKLSLSSRHFFTKEATELLFEIAKQCCSENHEHRPENMAEIISELKRIKEIQELNQMKESDPPDMRKEESNTFNQATPSASASASSSSSSSSKQ